MGLAKFFKHAKENFVTPTKSRLLSAVVEEGPSVTITKPPVRQKFKPPRSIVPAAAVAVPSNLGKRARTELEKQGTLQSSFSALKSGLEPIKHAVRPDKKANKAENAVQFIKDAKLTLDEKEYHEFQTYLREYRAKSLPIDQLVTSVQGLFNSDAKKPLLKGFATFIPPKHKAAYSDLLATIFTPTPSRLSEVTNSTPDLAPEQPVSLPLLSLAEDLAEDSSLDTEIDFVGQPPTTARSIDFEFHSQIALPSPKKGRLDLVTGKVVTKKLPRFTASEPLLDASVSKAPEELPQPATSQVVELSKEHQVFESQLIENDESSESGGLKCSVCQETATAPFVARCGHTCCKSCWDQWLSEQLSCPVCRNRVRQKQLTKLFFTYLWPHLILLFLEFTCVGSFVDMVFSRYYFQHITTHVIADHYWDI